ncbi:MAG: thiol peroxidase [Bacteroidales bacterium]
MEKLFFKGNPTYTKGTFPVKGEKAPCFKLINKELEEISFCSEKGEFNGCNCADGKIIVLNIFPSLDTPVCANTVRKFNQLSSQLEDVQLLCISQDLPFAAERFCVIEEIDNVIFASAYRSPEFGVDYGVLIEDGMMKGLFARAIIIIDREFNVVFSQIVEEISNEPDYDLILNKLRGLSGCIKDCECNPICDC